MSRVEVLTNDGASERVAESPAWVAILIVAAAFLVRVLFNVYVVGMQQVGLELFPDGKDYDALGLSLAAGTGFAIHSVPNTFRPPGYPLFLAALYMIFGHSYVAVKIAQSLLGALTCLMIFLIGQRLFSKRVGVIAATIATVYPLLVVYTGFLLSEALFVFLSTLFLYALVRFRECTSRRWIAAAGLVLGIMNLTRPVTLLLPAVLFVCFWIELKAKRRAAMIAGMLALWMLIPIMPWTIRNYTVRQAFILIADHQWVALYSANNRKILHDPDKIGGWIQPEGGEDYRAEYLAFMQDMLVHEPLEFLRLEFHKLHRFWSIVPTSSKTTSRDTIVSLFSYGLLLPLSVAGMVLSLKSPPVPWILYFWVLHFCLMALIVYGSTRLRAPVEPVLILFGALAVDKGWLKVVGETRGLSFQRVV